MRSSWVSLGRIWHLSKSFNGNSRWPVFEGAAEQGGWEANNQETEETVKKRRQFAALLALAFIIAGCASQPLPVADKPKPESKNFPFGRIATFDDVKAKFKGYHLSQCGKCYDKAVTESFFQLLKRERIRRKIYLDREKA